MLYKIAALALVVSVGALETPGVAKSVLQKDRACTVSSEIHTALIKFQTTAASTLAASKRSLKQRQLDFTNAKIAALKAVEFYSVARNEKVKAQRASSRCAGKLRVLSSEFDAQKSLIENELQCVAALEKSVSKLSKTRNIRDIEEIEQYQDTEAYQAATDLLQRPSEGAGSSVDQLRKLLRRLKDKLQKELASLAQKVKSQKKKCEQLKTALVEKTAAASVALTSKKNADAAMKKKQTRVLQAKANIVRVRKDYASERGVMANIRVNTNKVCKGRRVKKSRHNVCTMQGLIASLFAARAREHKQHKVKLAGLVARRKQARSDIGPAVSRRDRAKKASDDATEASESCKAGLRVSEQENAKMSRVIARELRLVKLLREKATCLTKASRTLRTDCSSAAAALSQLQESPAGGAALLLVELSRKHSEISGVLKLLEKLEKALKKERSGYAIRLAAIKLRCAKAATAAGSALSRFKGSAVVVEQVTRDYAKAKKAVDAYASLVATFDSERAEEEAGMKLALKHMKSFALTKWGQKWTSCRGRRN